MRDREGDGLVVGTKEGVKEGIKERMKGAEENITSIKGRGLSVSSWGD